VTSGPPARVFVALMLGEREGRALAAAVDPTLGPGFRRPRPEGLHLTLFFLGPVPREGLEGLAGALGHALRGLPVPRLRLGRAGAFPSLERARVLWVGVEPARGADAGALEELQAAVLRGLEAAGVDTRAAGREPFRPHVTVARARARVAGAPPAFRALDLERAWCPGQVALVESRSGAGPPLYAPLARFDLDPD